MSHRVCYWDEVLQMQCERDSTPEEDAQRAADILAESTSVTRINAPILVALELLDEKTPRAVREALITGDNSRVVAIETEAAALRLQLVKA
jgi:prophage DNA circulation protein